MKEKEILTDYVGAFIDELARIEVRHAVISPGSRSAPLSLMFHEHPDIDVWLDVDERSAAYFALGIAKAVREPVALVCTSGTAAANFFPAIVEACEAGVPLLVLTADRPHELRDTGAPQAIDQIKMYGSYVKWFQELALPEKSPQALRYVRTVAARAVAASRTKPAGPVHVNFPLREPLTPLRGRSPVTAGGRKNRQPFVLHWPHQAALSRKALQALVSKLFDVKKGWIVCGPFDDPKLSCAVVQLSKRLQFPIFADPLSPLRGGEHDSENVIVSYDALLRDQCVQQKFEPEAVIRFGAPPVSKPLYRYLENRNDVHQMIVEQARSWRDPVRAGGDVIEADPVAFCRELADMLPERKMPSDWLKCWRKMDETAKKTLATFANMERENFFEGVVFHDLSRIISRPVTLFVGNSMPVRDLDTFFMPKNAFVRTMANRGVNGIDGVVSTALGAASQAGPLVLVIGDLSFFHDLNALWLARKYRLNVTVVLVNNNGGGIFSFLPQARETEDFETLFGTPLDLDFSYAVQMYGGTFTRAKNREQFRNAVKKGIEQVGLSVVEICTDREENVQLHQQGWQLVQKNLREALPDVFER